MCGRVTTLSMDELLQVAREMAAAGELGGRDGAPSSGNARPQARPGSQVSALLPDAEGVLQITAFTWGFEAPWNGRLVYNARIESADGPMWAQAFSEGRAVLPVASFFEPHATETARDPRTGHERKRSYQFAGTNGAPLLLASVVRDGRLAVVTCPPNDDVAPIHPRMPLVLRPGEIGTWLGPTWRSLANRSSVRLAAEPEHNEPAQMALF